jgi:hypothetical protein
MPKHHAKYVVVYKKRGKRREALRHPVGKLTAMACVKVLRSLKYPIKAKVEKVK